jgi:hypothetical protein
MDRAIGRGMEQATANLPVIEQSRLETAMGVAEVELEDNSSLRLAPNSAVEFPKLDRMPNGATESWVRLLKGTAYVSLMKGSGSIPNNFTVLFGEQRLVLNGGSHIRLQITPDEAKLAVMDGAVQVQGSAGPIEVPKKHTVTLSLAGSGEPQVAKQLASEPLDSWDKDAVNYHARLAVMSGYRDVNSPYSYGMNDLAYYGNFMDAGGCGTMWRPYFASAAWDPYANGSWAWYGAAGYSWVSPYPWGWTPYHSGNWMMCPGVGWGWQPGGAWNGLNNMTVMPAQGGPNGPGVGHPLPPGHPPAKGDPTLVPVNMHSLVTSHMKSADAFEFRRDSAGLGIPRGTLGKLDGLSRQTLTKGTATTQVYVSAPRENGPMSNRASAGMNGEVFGASVRRGAPPPRAGDELDRSPLDTGSGSFSGGSVGRGGSPQPVNGRPPAGGSPGGSPGGGSPRGPK